MSPQATAAMPGVPVAPVATQTNNQGVGAPPAVGAPTPSALPTAPQVAATPAPVQNPTYDTNGMANAIATYYGIPRQTAQAVNVGQAQGNVAAQQFAAQKYQNTINIQNQQQELSPSGYTVTQSGDTKGTAPGSGLTITNVYGQPVSLGTYINLTGANPATVLENSNNPNDQAFVKDYTNFHNYVQTQIAAQGGDVQAQAELDDYYKNNPNLQGMELGQLSQMFMNTYGSYFGQPQSNQNTLNTSGLTPSLQSANNPLTTSQYENLTYYGAQEAANPYAVGFGNATGTVTGASAVGSTGANTSSLDTLLNTLQSQNTSGT